MTREVVVMTKVIKLLSDNFAYAWKPMQFRGAVYLYTNTNITRKFITDGAYFYKNNEKRGVTGGEK